MTKEVMIRDAKKEEATLLIPFFYGSGDYGTGENALDEIFPTPKQFLFFASQQEKNFWSYRYQKLLFMTDVTGKSVLASTLTRYQGSEAFSLMLGTIKTILNFYGFQSSLPILFKVFKQAFYYKKIPSKALYIANSCTLPYFRRRGFRTLLFKEIEKEAKEKGGIKELLLDVDQENKNAQRLNLLHGFSVTGFNKKMVRMSYKISL